MSKYHAIIERAIEHAPLLSQEAAGRAFVTGERDETVTNSSPHRLRDLNDHDRINVNVGVPLPANTAYVDANKEEFRELYYALRDVTKTPYTDSQIEMNVIHEGQHWRAAQMMRAKRALFGISIAKFKNNERNQDFMLINPEVHVLDWRTTKLELGLFIGYPDKLSTGDKYMINSMNYTVEDLAQKALLHNSSRRGLRSSIYPLPMSSAHRRAGVIGY